MHDFRVKFYLSPKSNKETGVRIVHARIYLDRNRDFLTSTKVAVPEGKWNAKHEKVTLNTPEGRLMNQRLANLRKTINDIYLQHEGDSTLTLELIKESYQEHARTNAGKEGVCTFFKQYIKENEEVLCEDTLSRYKHVTTLFGQYIAYTYNVKDIDFPDINHQMLRDFETYLSVKEGYTHIRTLHNKIYILKTLFGAAVELGMMEQDPFNGYSFRCNHSGKTESLTIEEIKLLKKTELGTKRLDKVRDCFLFSCYTGLSYQEVKTLTRDHLTRLNGSTWIFLAGVTEDTPRYIPLLPYPAKIIEKYHNDDEQAPLLPVISQQKTNLYLKEIAEICGFDKHLTFHLAVKSFEKIAMTAGASVESVCQMLGKPLHQAKPLMRFSPERIEDEMAMFAVKMGRDCPTRND